jgi:hypothetical protein
MVEESRQQSILGPKTIDDMQKPICFDVRFPYGAGSIPLDRRSGLGAREPAALLQSVS